MLVKLFSACTTVLLTLGPIAVAPPPPVATANLEARLSSICAKYEGKPIFDSNGETSYASCDWIRGVAAKAGAGPFFGYRKVLTATQSIDQVAASPALPKDLVCDAPARSTPTGQELECWTDLGMKIPVFFVADRDGVLRGVDMKLRYREMRRIASEQSVARGKISKFYDAFVDALTEVHVAVWDANKGPGDSLEFDGDNLEIHVASQRPGQ